MNFNEVEVFLLDEEVIGNATEEMFGTPLIVRPYRGLIKTPSYALVDGWDIVAKDVDTVDEDGRCAVLELFKSKYHLLPSQTVLVSKEDLDSFYTEKTTLAEFIKGRRGYNPRLLSNEREIDRWLEEQRTLKINLALADYGDVFLNGF
jgi:hypothetical protein